MDNTEVIAESLEHMNKRLRHDISSNILFIRCLADQAKNGEISLQELATQLELWADTREAQFRARSGIARAK